MALSRMLGNTVWFVTPIVAKQFSNLAASGSSRVTQGTYELDCGASLGAELREINLIKRQRRVHEQLWNILFGLLKSIHEEVGAGGTVPQEERLFLGIIDSARVLGDDWPSALRNVVNYRPGFAYTAPRFKTCIDSFSYLSMQEQTIDGVIDRLESNSIIMRRDPSVEAQPKVAAKMLADLAVLTSRLAHALHDEIVDRSGGDRRWLVSKHRFARQHGLVSSGAPWPC
jgi:hypothetical protein